MRDKVHYHHPVAAATVRTEETEENDATGHQRRLDATAARGRRSRCDRIERVLPDLRRELAKAEGKMATLLRILVRGKSRARGGQ